MYGAGVRTEDRTLGAAGERTAGVNLGKADLRFPETVEKNRKKRKTEHFQNGMFPKTRRPSLELNVGWCGISDRRGRV